MVFLRRKKVGRKRRRIHKKKRSNHMMHRVPGAVISSFTPLGRGIPKSLLPDKVFCRFVQRIELFQNVANSTNSTLLLIGMNNLYRPITSFGIAGGNQLGLTASNGSGFVTTLGNTITDGPIGFTQLCNVNLYTYHRVIKSRIRVMLDLGASADDGHLTLIPYMTEFPPSNAGDIMEQKFAKSKYCYALATHQSCNSVSNSISIAKLYGVVPAGIMTLDNYVARYNATTTPTNGAGWAISYCTNSLNAFTAQSGWKIEITSDVVLEGLAQTMVGSG